MPPKPFHALDPDELDDLMLGWVDEDPDPDATEAAYLDWRESLEMEEAR